MGKSFGSLVSGIALSAIASAAHAQSAPAPSEPPAPVPTSDQQLGDIIVTAQRRAENIQDIPASVTALQGNALNNQAAFEASDLVKYVPSVVVTSAFGGSLPSFTIRGVGRANTFEVYQVSPVGTYVDEVYQVFPPTAGQQIFDVDRVEVLRGPQGTLQGKNTTAGAINYVTRLPQLDSATGFAQVGYGSFNDVRAEAAFELSPIKDVLGIREAFYFERSDGYIHNVAPNGSNLNGVNTIAARLTLRYQPSSDLNIILKGYYTRNRDTSNGWFFEGNQPDGSYSFAGGLLKYSRVGLGFHEIEQPGPSLPYNRDYRGVDGWLTWKITPTLTLNSVSSYASGSTFYVQDTDGTPLQILTGPSQSKFQQWSQEVRLQYTGLSGLDLVLGGFYGGDRIRYAREDQVLFDLPTVSDLVNGIPPLGGNLSLYQKRDSFAGFVHGIYAVTDRLKLTVGLRYTHDLSVLTDIKAFLRLRLAPGGPIVPAVNTVPAFGPYDPTQFAPGLRDTENQLTGTVALDYELAPDLSVYANASRGYRAGADTAGTLSPAQIKYLAPEVVYAYEAGIKSEWFDRTLRVNVAGFYYDYRNQHVQEVIGPQTFLSSTGPAEIYGADFEVYAKPLRSLTVYSLLGLLHTKNVTNGELVAGPVKGNELPYAPGVTSRNGFDYTLYDSDSWKLALHGDASYVSRIFFLATDESYFPASGSDGRGLKQNGYWTFDGSASLRYGSNLEFSLWGKNLLDKDYFVSGFELRAAAGYVSFIQGIPRTFGGSVKYKF